MDSIIFLAFAVAYLALLVWGIVLANRHGWWTPANLVLLVLVALVYDNLIIGVGGWIIVGAVVMTIGSAIQLPVESNAITNAFELALLTSIMATKAFQDRRSVSGTARHGEPVGEPA